MTPEERLAALEELSRLKAQAAQTATTQSAQEPPKKSLGSKIMSVAGIPADIALTIGGNALASTAGGVVGAAGFFGPGSLEEQGTRANNWYENIAKLGYTPKNEYVQYGLSKVAPTIEKVENWVDDHIFALSGGSPAIATMAKTALFGIPDAMGMAPLQEGLIGARAAKTAAENAAIAAGKAQLESIGINTKKPTTIPDQTVRAAKTMGVDPERGARMGQVLESLKKEQETSKKVMDTAWKGFRDQYGGAEVDVRPLEAAAKSIKEQLLLEGFDLKSSPKTSALLDDLGSLRKQNVATGEAVPGGRNATTIQELDLLRRRASIASKGKLNPEKASLISLRKHLEATLDEMFQKSAEAAGKAVRTQGDNSPTASAINESWKNAKAVSRDYYSKFDGPTGAAKQVKRLLANASTPEDVWTYLVGASSLNNKAGTVDIIKHLKSVVGDTDPVITEIRKAAVSDILRPMLGDEYDFSKLVSNIDFAINNRYSLLKELGVSSTDLLALRKAAVVSKDIMSRNPEKFDARYITQQGVAIAVGNSMAKNAGIMRTIRKVIGRVISKSESKEALRNILGSSKAVPIIEQSTSAGDWLMGVSAMAVPAGLNANQEEE